MFETKKKKESFVVPTKVFKGETGENERSSDWPGLPVPGGMSNTPLTSIFNTGRSVFIDYLKVRFHGEFNARNQTDLDMLYPLFKILKLNPLYFDEKFVKSYKFFYEYDDGTAIMSSNELTESKTGPSHYLELKGQGCRAFEKRGGSWSELIEYCYKFYTNVNRIDLSLDDTSGIIKIPQILDKVYKGHYTSDLRTWKIRDGSPVDSDAPDILESKNSGCTITFGTPASKQLVIYNKIAERLAKNYVVHTNDWIRYESRWFHEVGNKVLPLVHEAFQNNSMEKLVPQLIKSLVDFKVYSNDKNKSQLKTWHLWDELLTFPDDLEERITNKAEEESTLASKQQWLVMASGRILGKVFLSNPYEFNNYINYCTAQAIDKFNHVDLQQVNNLRIEHGEEVLSMEEAKTLLRQSFERHLVPSEYLAKVLRFQDASSIYNNEMRNEDNE